MVETRVSNIEQTVGGDGAALWIVSFEGKKLILAEKQQPTYKVGDILPFNLRVVKPPAGQKGDWYYVRAEGTSATASVSSGPKPTPHKSYTADPQKIESIEYQNARNLAVQMYCQVTEAGVEPDYELLDTIFRRINALGKDLVTIAKEQYGAKGIK